MWGPPPAVVKNIFIRAIFFLIKSLETDKHNIGCCIKCGPGGAQRAWGTGGVDASVHVPCPPFNLMSLWSSSFQWAHFTRAYGPLALSYYFSNFWVQGLVIFPFPFTSLLCFCFYFSFGWSAFFYIFTKDANVIGFGKFVCRTKELI